MLERLQKIIARAGIASRRHAEEMITSGLVTVNGKMVSELGTKADEATDHIKVSGKLLRPVEERVSLVFNKPTEVISTMIDPEGRRTILDFLQKLRERVFPVGVLEYHESGLVFLTSDGDLANRMLKAQHLRATYQIKLKTLLTFAEIESLSRFASARISRMRGKEAPWYEVTMPVGRADALRNRLFQTGHFVEKTRRTSFGSLELDRLAPGEYRVLAPGEIAALARLLEPNALQASKAKESPRRGRSSMGSSPGASARGSIRTSMKVSTKSKRKSSPRTAETGAAPGRSGSFPRENSFRPKHPNKHRSKTSGKPRR